MNKRITLLFLFFVVFSSLIFNSCKSAKLSDAIAKEERGEYYDAADIYRRVYSKTSSTKKRTLKGSVAFHMSNCYRKVNLSKKAQTGYQSAIRYGYTDSTAVFFYALMLQRNGNYTDAIKQYNAFLELDPNNRWAKNGIIGCDSAVVWKKNPTRYTVKREDKINSRRSDYSPMLAGEQYDQLYITTTRDEVMGGERSAITGVKFSDIFVAKKDEKGQWQAPAPLEEGLNTEMEEGACSFTSNGSTMYYTFCPQDEEHPRTAEIMKSSRSGAKWNKGQKVDIFNDSLKMAAHPAIDPSGKYLYFVSDVMGGQGGKDIWRIEVDAIGRSYPENLGAEINTPGDEMFPYMRTDSIMYFASNGHPGMGGLDIFKATLKPKGNWVVENMKSPINSNGDDFGITFEGKRESGFFSSNRNDARGHDHIYSFSLPSVNIFVEGWVLDKDEEIVENAIIRIVGKDGTNEKIFARKDGSYRLELTRGMDYVMMASAPGFLNQKQSLTTPNDEKSETFYVDFSLASITKPVLIENIFYDFNKATLRPESQKALDELITLLKDNPNVTIELMAHTDRIGSAEYNLSLSQRRAQSVVDYLIKGGIEKERLTAVGYGKTQPKTVTRNIAKQHEFLPEGKVLSEEFIQTLTPQQQEIADQINRRTEFKVLRTNYRLF
ncbi:MAG: OmpA family protein [Dysgonamonadaceae bacterium]|jgi:peptidoglycan-associated lipoprotein|nr:OmpA family protein [Dysgonamonadaceae bacterium]